MDTNLVLTCEDVWLTETAVHPRFATDQKEALLISAELKNGAKRLVLRPYTRIGSLLLIDSSPPKIHTYTGSLDDTCFWGNWFIPTPTPENN